MFLKTMGPPWMRWAKTLDELGKLVHLELSSMKFWHTKKIGLTMGLVTYVRFYVETGPNAMRVVKSEKKSSRETYKGGNVIRSLTCGL